MLIYVGNKVFEVSKAETVQKMEEVKKLFKTDIALTDKYAIQFYVTGSSEKYSTVAAFTKEEAENLLYELFQNGRLDLSEYGGIFGFGGQAGSL